MCLTLTVAYLVPTLCGAGVDSRHRSVVGPGGRQTGERLDRPIDRGGGGDDDDDDDAVVTRLSRARSAEEELPRELVSFHSIRSRGISKPCERKKIPVERRRRRDGVRDGVRCVRKKTRKRRGGFVDTTRCVEIENTRRGTRADIDIQRLVWFFETNVGFASRGSVRFGSVVVGLLGGLFEDDFGLLTRVSFLFLF